MNKEEFISTLKSENPVQEQKLETCQYFVENYPVLINEVINTPIGSFQTGRKIWTSLPDYQVKNDKKAMDKLEENYNKLVERIKEIEEYDKK